MCQRALKQLESSSGGLVVIAVGSNPSDPSFNPTLRQSWKIDGTKLLNLCLIFCDVIVTEWRHPLNIVSELPSWDFDDWSLARLEAPIQQTSLKDPAPFWRNLVPNMLSSSWNWINQFGSWLYKQSSCVRSLSLSFFSTILRLQHLITLVSFECFTCVCDQQL